MDVAARLRLPWAGKVESDSAGVGAEGFYHDCSLAPEGVVVVDDAACADCPFQAPEHPRQLDVG